jgi:hypothetical protein
MEAVDNADRSKYPQLFIMLLTSECEGFTRERASGDLSHSILAPGQRSDRFGSKGACLGLEERAFEVRKSTESTNDAKRLLFEMECKAEMSLFDFGEFG